MEAAAFARLREIWKQFDIADAAASARPYGNGHINETYLLTLDSGNRIILQQVNSYVFHNPVQIMENIDGISRHLESGLRGGDDSDLREVLRFISSRDGCPYLIDDAGCFWRAYRYVEGAHSHDKTTSAAVFENAGRTFGAFFARLADYPTATLHETIPGFHHTPGRIAQFENAVALDSCGRAADVEADIRFVRERIPFVFAFQEKINRGLLTPRVAHNDTKLNNVLLDSTTGRGVCVIDLDTVMPGIAAHDFGDSIRYGANTADEDEPDLTRVGLSMELFKAYTTGFLARAGICLTDSEILSLPDGAFIMTLECGIRFLTDHINGDKYFRIKEPGQNLRRARVQFALLADMERQRAEMDDIVTRLGESRIWEQYV